MFTDYLLCIIGTNGINEIIETSLRRLVDTNRQRYLYGSAGLFYLLGLRLIDLTAAITNKLFAINVLH